METMCRVAGLLLPLQSAEPGLACTDLSAGAITDVFRAVNGETAVPVLILLLAGVS